MSDIMVAIRTEDAIHLQRMLVVPDRTSPTPNRVIAAFGPLDEAAANRIIAAIAKGLSGS